MKDIITEFIDNYKKTVLYTYNNGNTFVTIFKNGTKVRAVPGNESPRVEHPETIDVKITNYCDLGCSYCHEMSTREGKHGDLDKLMNVLKELPAGVELAIGGGNPLDHPKLLEFLTKAKKHGFICNLTVNQKHLKKHEALLTSLITDNLIKGLGISITSQNYDSVIKMIELSPNVVLHLIAGVNTISSMDYAIENFKYAKVLILGYKDVGRGIKFRDQYVDTCLNDWKKFVPQYIKLKDVAKPYTISFDNLAIEQLDIKGSLSKKEWEKFYMGDDFIYSMYIDAVEQKYSPTSRASQDERVSFETKTLKEFFKDKK